VTAEVTYQACAASATRRLEEAGIDASTARLDVSVLARALLGWDAARWIADQRGTAPVAFVESLSAWTERRARHEPVAYITGSREFFGRSFQVTPDVLIPRPDTETLVTAALECIDALDTGAPLVADVGTGSGCLAVTLAAERRHIRVLATDTSPGALEVARKNAARHGVLDRVSLHLVSLLDGLGARPDLLLSNPPYVRDDERLTLPREVFAYEPHAALFSGPDGLDLIRTLVRAAGSTLPAGGWLALEIGAGQAPEVQRLVEDTAELDLVSVRPDIEHRPRVVIARRR